MFQETVFESKRQEKFLGYAIKLAIRNYAIRLKFNLKPCLRFIRWNQVLSISCLSSYFPSSYCAMIERKTLREFLVLQFLWLPLICKLISRFFLFWSRYLVYFTLLEVLCLSPRLYLNFFILRSLSLSVLWTWRRVFLGLKVQLSNTVYFMDSRISSIYGKKGSVKACFGRDFSESFFRSSLFMDRN